jgi:hypothetical protein
MRTRNIALPLLLASIFCATWPSGARAEEEKKVLEVGKWYPIVETGLNLTQGSYTQNWVGGDQGSIVWSMIANAGLQSQLTPKLNWNNTLKLAYGQTHQQKTDPGNPQKRVWDVPEKSTDLFSFETILRFTLGGFVDPYVAGQFESQFQDASDPYGRKLSLNPLIFGQSAGIARKFVHQENSELLSRVGLSVRENFRKNFTDTLSKSTTNESTRDAGLEWVTEGKTKLAEDRLVWNSKLTVYQPFAYSAKSDFQDALGAMTAEERAGIPADAYNYTTVASMNWENIFTSQITKLLSVTLYTRWLYDKYDSSTKPLVGPDGKLTNPEAVHNAIRTAGQFKETLSIGLTYRIL